MGSKKRRITGYVCGIMLVIMLLFVMNYTTRAEESSTVYEGVDYSEVYDFEYYSSHNPDVVAVYGMDPQAVLGHFVRFGMAEGRKGNSSFDVFSYRNQYGDLRAAYGSDLKAYYIHYIRFGKAEGRKTSGCTTLQNPVTVYEGVDYSPVYDYEYYISNNSDVVSVYGKDDLAVLSHFVRFGMSEGRQGRESFSVYVYRARYADIRLAYGSDLKACYMHYLNWGISEGRTGAGPMPPIQGITVLDGVDYSLVYNYQYYIAHNSDVKEAYGDDDIAALRHFVRWGMSERRAASATFDVNSYINEYADCRTAFKDNYAQYYLHYIKYGKNEGRHGTGCTELKNPTTNIYGYNIASIYDYYYYVEQNPDVVAKYGKEDFKIIQHFADYGIHEGRPGKASYNSADYIWFEKRMYSDGMFEKAQGYSSPTPYLIMVDLTNHLCGVYYGSQGDWNLVWKDLCGPGMPETPTPVAVTAVYEKYLYFDSGSVRLWYATPFNGPNYFHSVSYIPDDGPYVVDDPTIGVDVSHGCVRLPIDKAKWVYDNIPIGTTVVTYR